MGSGNTTVPSTNDVAATLRAVHDTAPALVIVWSAREPHRIGEVAMFDGRSPWVLGRASFDVAQLEFQRQRPHASVVTGALKGESISRRQIEIDRTKHGLSLENVGQARMRVNGVESTHAEVLEGDVIEIRGHYVLLVVMRPVSLGDAFDWPTFAFGEPDAFGIVGESPAAWKLRAEIAFGARAATHVLVHGGSGTGKELCAAALHALSSRSRGPFIARNAATFPAGLVDAELFGNAKNYPNAGMPEREGLVGAANGGTLFLDEIGEIPTEMQAHLLRLFDSGGEYHRLGETKARRADVRLVCATNRDVSSLKHDLLARLKLGIETPPLHVRREDIPLIARHLVVLSAATNPAAAPFVRRGEREEADIAESLAAALVQQQYTTNIRELEKTLLRAMQWSPSPPLRLPETAVVRVKTQPNEPVSEADVRAALEKHRWNVSRAADALGVSRFVLGRLVKKYGLRET